MPFPLIAAGLSAGASYLGAKMQNKANIKASQKQMDFQREMSSTAYQRSMADMKKAGLNPILAYSKGGASTPGGAQIPAVNELEGSVQSAQAARRLSAELSNLKEQNANLKKTNINIDADTQSKIANAQLAKTSALNVLANTDVLKENLHSAKAKSEDAKIQKRYRATPVGQGLGWWNRVLNDLVGTKKSTGEIAAGVTRRRR